MNQTIETILNRRSVRVYSEDQIKQEDLDLVLQAGCYAPSGCNMQPWHFTVVQNKEILNTLNIETKNELQKCDNEYFQNFAKSEKYDIFYNAPTAIVISGEKKALVPQIDCAAATENMILAADSLNIGTCWIGLITFLFRSKRAEEFLRMLQIPEGYEPYYAISLGYKKIADPKPQPRREHSITYIK